MKFALDSAPVPFRIQAHGEGWVSINGERHERSLVLTPQNLRTDWPPTGIETLAPEHANWLCEDQPEVVLLGTGPRQRFPSGAFLGQIARHGLSPEVMDNGAACRTYTILISEGRRVSLGLLL
ncbi:MAG: Mth938-like domain-containing protein [Halothiobacillaceae bacterium]|nr:Mth938-like domain-containing protein [Halothiobacillaceae bacterium]